MPCHVHPEGPLAYRYLAASLGQLGCVEEAHNVLEKAIELSPGTLTCTCAAAHHGSDPRTMCTYSPGCARRACRVDADASVATCE